MTLYLVEGPAGSGKSGTVAEMLAAGEVQIQSDVTSLWQAFSNAVRGPDGRFPERLDDDVALALARYIQGAAVRHGLSEGLDVAVTSSRPDQVERWRQVSADAGTPFSVRTVDPGEQVVRARLADPVSGILSPECLRAVRRWYG